MNIGVVTSYNKIKDENTSIYNNFKALKDIIKNE